MSVYYVYIQHSHMVTETLVVTSTLLLSLKSLKDNKIVKHSSSPQCGTVCHLLFPLNMFERRLTTFFQIGKVKV